MGYVGDLRSHGGYQLVDALGGSVAVESTVGVVVTFTVGVSAWD
jgi:hypothetical protein